MAEKTFMTWQNELLTYKDEKGEGYAPTYLKTIHSQLRQSMQTICRQLIIGINSMEMVRNL